MTPKRSRYSRPLSGMERYSLALNEIYRYNVVAVIEGRGHIGHDHLGNAVAAAAAANPGVRVRLRSLLGFSRWVDSGIGPRVHAHSRGDWGYQDETRAGFIHDRFDPLHGGPIADVHAVHDDQQTTTAVVFRAVHAAMDGGGMAHWMMEVFRALRGERLLGSPATDTDFQVAGHYRAQIQQAIAANPANAPQSIRYSPAIPVSPAIDQALRYVWRVVRINGHVANLLPRLAILLSQHARAQSQGHIGFTVPIDFRGLRTEIHSTGNLTGYLRIQVEPTDSARAVMVKIARQIRDHVDCQAPLNTQPVRWVRLHRIVRELERNLPNMLYEDSTGFPTAGLVSMGNVDLRAYDAPGFDAELIVGIPGSVGRLNIVAGLLPKETVLTLSTPSSYNKDGQLDVLARAVAEGLGE
jgi:hypothetical protein